DVRKRRIEAVVCGHPNPMIAHPKAGQTTIESTGIPLGIIATFPYESITYDLEPNSTILFYTDGLSEALYGGRMIGQKGIERLLERPELHEDDLQDSLRRLIASPNITIED